MQQEDAENWASKEMDQLDETSRHIKNTHANEAGALKVGFFIFKYEYPLMFSTCIESHNKILINYISPYVSILIDNLLSVTFIYFATGVVPILAGNMPAVYGWPRGGHKSALRGIVTRNSSLSTIILL